MGRRGRAGAPLSLPSRSPKEIVHGGGIAPQSRKREPVPYQIAGAAGVVGVLDAVVAPRGSLELDGVQHVHTDSPSFPSLSTLLSPPFPCPPPRPCPPLPAPTRPCPPPRAHPNR
ncbi:unnamed protein product [Closterium sp. Naga37s-1]|nr:unnamed protein product [Closterium sp. Naga37s-1]